MGKDEQTQDAATPEEPEPLPALLPAYVDRLYMAQRQAGFKARATQLQRLARHEGPSCAAHVPAHALDEQRVRVLYVPDELIRYT